MRIIKRGIIEALNFYNKDNINNLSITAIAKQFKIDKKTLMFYIENNSINITELVEFNDNYYLFEDKEYEAINEYINTDINFLGIRNKYGYKQETFKKKLEVLGYPTERKYKCNYNRDKFKTIETEEDAYILGFILADGYINERINMLRIKLQEKDIDILEKICDYFEMDYSFIKYEIHKDTGNKQYYISIYNKEIISRLKSYGLYQHKSCNETPYYEIKKELVRHYIRGIWDGDGHILKDLTGTGVCGSEEILIYIYEVLKSELDLYPSRKNKMIYFDKSSNIYRLHFSTRNVYMITNYLYENATIYLNRKYELYKQIDDKKNCHV